MPQEKGAGAYRACGLFNRTVPKAIDGIFSVAIWADGSYADGTVWIEREFHVPKEKIVNIYISFWLYSSEKRRYNNWQVISYAGQANPENENDFRRIGYAGKKTRWHRYNYSKTLYTYNSSRILTAVGINVVREKFATYYIDYVNVTINYEQSEGEYIYDMSFSTLPEDDISDIETNNTYIWIIGVTQDTIYRFWPNGTLDKTGNVSIGRISGGPVGLDFNETHFFVSDNAYKEVYVFLKDGTYTGFHFDTERQISRPHSVVFKGTYYWVGGPSGKVSRYKADGTYDDWSIHLNEVSGTIMGLDFYNGYWYVQEYRANYIYRYSENWEYDGWSLNITAQDRVMEGVAFNGTYFWTIGNEHDQVYRYSRVSDEKN